LTLVKFSVLLGQVVTTLDGFFEAPFSVHFCLMNLGMICQTVSSRRKRLFFLIVTLLWPIFDNRRTRG
jgi:hypothetical protein